MTSLLCLRIVTVRGMLPGSVKAGGAGVAVNRRGLCGPRVGAAGSMTPSST